MAGEEENQLKENETENASSNKLSDENEKTNEDPDKTDQQLTDKQTINGQLATEVEDQDESPEQEVTEIPSQEPNSPGACSNERLTRLPITRIKHIMKTDPDVTLASQEAVVALAKATELFIGSLSKDAVVGTLNSKRKTLQRKDLDTVLDTRDGYAFLEGTLD